MRQEATGSSYSPFQSPSACRHYMFAGIHKWYLESEFDPDVADSSHIVDIAGIPVVSVFVVLGSAVLAFVEAEIAACFDAVYAGQRQRPTGQA